VVDKIFNAVAGQAAGSGWLRVTAWATLVFACSGCATALVGTTQNVGIRSEPTEAQCVLTRDGKTIATVDTPATVTLEKSSKPVEVSCTKAGFGEGRAVMSPRTAGTPIPISAVGVVFALGSAVDHASGASSRYERGVMVWLPPLAPGEAAPAAQGQPGS
jgi:hypothetical protein